SDVRQRALLGQEIAGLANRSHHVGRFHGRRRLRFVHRTDLVVGVVERRPDQVVHGRVHDDEALGLGRLAIEHSGQQDAGVADDRSPWLDDHGDVELTRERHQHGGVVLVAGRLLVAVAGARAGARLEVARRGARRPPRLGPRRAAGPRARTPISRATSASARSSLTDSTLSMRMSALSASRISSRVLPRPEKMIFFGGTPARSARNNSPPLTMSAPAPARASVASTPRLALAFTA